MHAPASAPQELFPLLWVVLCVPVLHTRGSYFGRLERAHERNDLQVSAHQPDEGSIMLAQQPL